MTLGLLLIFGSYYAGVSMFAHTHIVHGSSVVHSHLGGDADHDHSDGQYAVIDLLSSFQSECAEYTFNLENPFFTLSDFIINSLLLHFFCNSFKHCSDW